MLYMLLAKGSNCSNMLTAVAPSADHVTSTVAVGQEATAALLVHTYTTQQHVQHSSSLHSHASQLIP